MTKTEFDQRENTIACKFCEDLTLIVAEAKPPHEHEVRCAVCGRHQFFLQKEKNEGKRQRLKSGTIPDVWEEYGNHCAHCGLSVEEIDYIGISKTVQHVPPYTVAGNNGKLIPLCDWCQQDSASKMKRFTSLIRRLRGQDDGNAAIIE